MKFLKNILNHIIIFLILAFFTIISEAFAISSQNQTLVSDSTFDATADSTPICLVKGADEISLYLKAVNGAGSSPTLDVIVKHSDDQTNWFTFDTFTQATTGTSLQLRHINQTTTHALRCFKITGTLGGTGSPTYDLIVKIFYKIKN